jgi:hypothetical protein
MPKLRRLVVLGTVAGVVLSACVGDGSMSPSSAESTSTSQAPVNDHNPADCADVVDVVVSAEAGGTYRFDVTVRSPDTGWDKYADLWEVRDPSGRVLGERVLAHPHVEEQPFTRSQSGIEIPAGVTTVVVAARDSVTGFCGASYEVAVP